MSRAVATLATTCLVVVAMAGAGGAVVDVSTDGTKPSTAAVSSSPPTAAFDYSPSTPNPDDEIELDATEAWDNGTIECYAWDTNGDGDYDSYGDADDGPTTSETFESGGTYTVGLRVTDDNGNTDTTTTQITVENPDPSASFEYAPSTPNPDDEIELDASGSGDPDGSIESYEWDTNGDGDYDSYGDADDGPTTSVTFETGGTYTVRLRVEDNGGETDTTTTQITVENPAPTANFDFAPESPNPDDEIELDASGSSDSDGTIESYEWDTNGDGDYDSYGDADDGSTTSISFDTGGTYTVGLRVEDNGGKTETMRISIFVENPAPTASFEYTPESPNPDDEIRLDASGSSDSDGSIESYEWDTDGDGEYDSYGDVNDGPTTSVTFESGGTYTVGLRVEDNGETVETDQFIITVRNPGPTAELSVSPDEPNPDDEITLDASGSSDPDGEIATYEWDTDGDGEYGGYGDPDNGPTASIGYEVGGTYEVGLRVVDNGGKTASLRRAITVENPEPSASFDYRPETPELGESAQFDGSKSSDPDGEIVSYTWYLDGDRVGQGEQFSRSFDREGSYNVTLVVTDNGQVSASTSATVPVSEPPDASISSSPAVIGQNRTVTFDAGGSYDPDGSITTYRWTFSDGETARGETVTRRFATVGNHSVELTVVDDATLANRTNETITIYPIPSATISADPAQPVEGTNIDFRAVTDDAIVAYEWDLDSDGEAEKTGQTVPAVFDEYGEHNVSVALTSQNGVTNTTSRTISVDRNATFELTSNRGTIQQGGTVVVTFSISNNIRDRALRTKLQFALPDTGASISSVEGGSVSGRSATNFVTVPAGEQQTLRVRMQFNEPGDYGISGQSVYYYGDQSSSQQQSVGPVDISVQPRETATATSGAGPGFGILLAVTALLCSVVARRLVND
jgi:PKD repeat protein